MAATDFCAAVVALILFARKAVSYFTVKDPFHRNQLPVCDEKCAQNVQTAYLWLNAEAQDVVTIFVTDTSRTCCSCGKGNFCYFYTEILSVYQTHMLQVRSMCSPLSAVMLVVRHVVVVRFC